jgi:hypothetical protein
MINFVLIALNYTLVNWIFLITDYAYYIFEKYGAWDNIFSSTIVTVLTIILAIVSIVLGVSAIRQSRASIKLLENITVNGENTLNKVDTIGTIVHNLCPNNSQERCLAVSTHLLQKLSVISHTNPECVSLGIVYLNEKRRENPELYAYECDYVLSLLNHFLKK